MKLTEARIKQIIREELERMQEETIEEDAAATAKAMEAAPKLMQAKAQEVFKDLVAMSDKSGGAMSPEALAQMVSEFIASMKK